MTDAIDVRIRTPVQYTEAPARVASAIETLFPNASIESNRDEVTATTSDLEQLRVRMQELRILDTARSVFRDSADDSRFRFRLKKQAALQNRINFSVGSPDELGDISVTVAVSDGAVESTIQTLTATDSEETGTG